MKIDINLLTELLENAEPLNNMGIKIEEISRDGDRAVYVAEIPAGERVTPHYHPNLSGGTEWYHVFESSDDAEMNYGTPIIDGVEVVDVKWDEPLKIYNNSFFIVPNGIVHSLFAGKSKLRFTFGCPDAHLDDNLDKVVLAEFKPK